VAGSGAAGGFGGGGMNQPSDYLLFVGEDNKTALIGYCSACVMPITQADLHYVRNDGRLFCEECVNQLAR
jgi:hypothetical protein